jgi:hypothetical protein
MGMETVKNLLKKFYLYFAFMWLFLGSAVYFIDKPAFKKWYYFIILLVMVFAVALIVYFCKRKINRKIESPDCEIEIVFDDLLSLKNHTVVIPVNDVFDTEIGNIIDINSIQGQFTESIYHGNIGDLNNDIDQQLISQKKYAINDPDKLYGKKTRYPLGTCIALGNEPRYLLLVIAKMDKTYERAEKVSIDDLWDVFSKLQFEKSLIIFLYHTCCLFLQ